MKKYKIRDRSKPDMWSLGCVEQAYHLDNGYWVKFNKKGKTWDDLRLVKRHILNAVMKGVPVANWEILTFEITNVTTVTELAFGPEITLAILKSSK